MEISTADPIWLHPGEQSLPPSGRVQCRELTACWEFDHEELRVAINPPPESEPNWQRWTVETEGGDISIVPMVPDRSVVFEPLTRFFLLPAQSTRIYIEIPLNIAFKWNGQTLVEAPSETLSQTWFGEFDAGEVCYWVAARAHREAPVSRDNTVAISPLMLSNRSDDTLEVSRICLRTCGLNLYRADGVIWTSETEVIHRGGDAQSRVDVVDGPPPTLGSATLLTSRRQPLTRAAVGRTFRSLMEWTISTILEE
ncbi:MAG: DUF432 domain-containing protein [Verrucomicrobiota bacterium]